MKNFINEAVENMIYEDVVNNFSNNFNEKEIRQYILENYGSIDENILGRVITKAKSGIAKIAGSMKNWIKARMEQVKKFYNASRAFPIVLNSKNVFFKLTKDSDKVDLRTDSLGRAFMGSKYDPSKNTAVIVFGNPMTLSKKPSIAESKFLNKFSNQLSEINLAAINSAELDDRASRGHEYAPIAGKGLKAIDDLSSKRFDLMKQAGLSTGDFESELEEPSRSSPDYVEPTNIVNVRTLQWHIRDVLATVITNRDSQKIDPPRIFIAGPPGTGKTKIVEAFDGAPVETSASSHGGARSLGKWKVHVLEVDKLFAEIFSGFPVEVITPVFKKIKDGEELSPEDQKIYRDVMDHGSKNLDQNREEINAKHREQAIAALKKDQENYVRYDEKTIQLKQTDLFPDKDDPGYHIFFFDELNRGDAEKIGAVMNLLYQGKIGSAYHVPRNSCMISAGNVGDGIIDFEKIKALYGTFFTRMQRIFVTTYDWESRMVYGNKYKPSKKEYFTPGAENPDKFDSVLTDLGSEDPPIVTDAINELIKQYGNSFSYVVTQLNKDHEPYNLDYRWFSNLSDTIKKLALRDWNNLPEKSDGEGGFKSKEDFIRAFEKIDSGENTEDVTYTFGDKTKIKYKAASIVSPVHLFMIKKQFKLFSEALNYSLSDAAEGQTLKQFILGKIKQKWADRLSINIEDLKYTLSVAIADQKVKDALLDESKDTFTGLLHSIQSLITKHKSGDSYWDAANNIIPNIELAVKKAIKDAGTSALTKKFFQELLDADVKDDDKKNKELRIKRIKGTRLLAANISVIFDLQKGESSGIAKIDYMQTIVTEIAKAKLSTSDMSDADKVLVEKWVDDLNALLDSDHVFQTTRMKTSLNLGSIKKSMEEAKKSAPDSFQIMNFLTTNPTAISNNTYLKMSDVDLLTKEISRRYEQEYESRKNSGDGARLEIRPDIHLTMIIPDIKDRNFKAYINKLGKESGNPSYASNLINTPTDYEYKGIKFTEFDLQRFVYNYNIMKVLIKRESEMKENWENYDRRQMENESKKIEMGFSIILEKMAK